MRGVQFVRARWQMLRAWWEESLLCRRRVRLLRLLSGSGLEIGALNFACEAPHLKVTYVDRLPAEVLREHYPELAAEEIIEADIVDDAEALDSILDYSQDFVIAHHLIEHLANPIKALLNWQRVLRPGGRLYLAVPDCRKSFDRSRSKTTLEHLYKDFEQPSKERDYLHVEDYALHVSSRTYHIVPEGQAKNYAKELFEKDISIHFHVWDFDSFRDFLESLQSRIENWQMTLIAAMPPRQHEFVFVLERKEGAADMSRA